MPAPKKYTQFIFDGIDSPNNSNPHGFLSLMFEVFKEMALIRNKKRLSQHDLAKKCGIAQATIAKIEAGRGNPTLLQLTKIAHALGQKITFEPTEFPPGDYEGYLE